MVKRRIGSLEVTLVGVGCNNFGWRIDQRGTVDVVNAAIEVGINFFDTADVYDTGRSEEFLGKALGARRRDVVVATKFGRKRDDPRRGGKPAYVRQACEDTSAASGRT